MTSAIDPRLQAIFTGIRERTIKLAGIYEQLTRSANANSPNNIAEAAGVRKDMDDASHLRQYAGQILNPSYYIDISPAASQQDSSALNALQKVHDAYVNTVNFPNSEDAKQSLKNAEAAFNTATEYLGREYGGFMTSFPYTTGKFTPIISLSANADTPGAVSSIARQGFTTETATQYAVEQFEQIKARLDEDIANARNLPDAQPGESAAQPKANTDWVPAPAQKNAKKSELTYAQTLAQLLANRQNSFLANSRLRQMFNHNADSESSPPKP